MLLFTTIDAHKSKENEVVDVIAYYMVSSYLLLSITLL